MHWMKLCLLCCLIACALACASQASQAREGAAPPAKPAPGQRTPEKPAPARPAPAKPAPTVPEDKLAEARELYAGRCVPCHGPSGRGDGVAATSLQPKPRNFTDKAWQQSVTDAHLEKVIREGGAAVGKSPLMPANPDLQDLALLAAVREVVRSFGR